ncbi:MAG TPA: class I tRNA ligase family protein [Turneriella sp.]|nr:class I tRNA ligase family protein [Turneriella sp.]
MKQKIFITTPIYYVNARPHIGHAYTTIACDTWARYQRLAGKEVFFLTGTDEHGDKIVKAAAAEGKTPGAYCDEISGSFKSAWQKLGLTPDDFIRTTEPRHKSVVQQILQKIYDAGDIYAGEYTGKYCFGCERYLTDKELNEKGECETHLTVPQVISEKNYFFRMQKYLPIWKAQLQQNPSHVEPQGFRNEVLGTIDELIKNGEDLSISRPKTRLEWGIEIPFDKDYVTYVWFDALINYVTAAGYPVPLRQAQGDKDSAVVLSPSKGDRAHDAVLRQAQHDEGSFNDWWANAHHMIAKDIVKPHGVYWPTMLIAAGIPVYKRLSVHGYWLGFADQKMSKSLGNAKDPLELAGKIGNDALRFFLMREMNFGSDARFSEEIMINRLNANLANDLGNLVQRTLSMLKKYECGPNPNSAAHASAAGIDESLKTLKADYIKYFENFEFHNAIEAVFTVIRSLNKVVDDYKPWSLAKENMAECALLLNTLLRAIAVMLLYLRPVLPEKTGELLSILQVTSKQEFPEALSEVSFAEQKLDTWPMLFQRMEIPAAG